MPRSHESRGSIALELKTHLVSLSFIVLLLGLSTAVSADPWGCDADLATRKVYCQSKSQGPLQKVGECLIRFHQEVISPIDGPRSHYRPSSSQYAMDAIKSYGFLTGVMMGCDRLMRENKERWIYETVPFDGARLKWDPVDGSRSPCPEDEDSLDE